MAAPTTCDVKILLANSEPSTHVVRQCPLSGVERTSAGDASMSANDPKRTSAPPELLLRKIAVEPHFANCRFLFELHLL
jgi:hypothetical protein